MTVELNEAFEAAAREIQGDYEKADSDWKPPVGKYTCLLTDLRTGAKVDPKLGNKNVLWMQPVYKILEGQYANAQFRGDNYSDRSPQSLGFVRSFMETALGEASGIFVEDAKALAAITGSLVVEVDVVRRGEYTNARLTRVLETAAA